jgi:DNA-directed RNA polymerase specialized sigma24 family protein
MPKHEKKKDPAKKPTFEESYGFINQEITKRKGKWNLTSLHWMDYDDVSQIIRIHIYEKWHLYDSSKPLGPWVNRIISNQIKNLIRNNYGNFSRPCLKCEAARPNNGCDIYEIQCAECPLYAKWQKTKKSAYDIKIPLALEDHAHEVNPVSFDDGVNLHKFAENLHKKMKEILKPNEWIVYKGLFIKNKSEEEVAKYMGFKSNEENRSPGYKQIKNIRKKIIEKVKKCLQKDEVDYL